MSLPRFFLEHQVLADEREAAFPLRLSDDDARHARVLRLRPGEHIAVIDAALDYFECELVAFEDDVLVRIAGRGGPAASAPFITLYQALPKGDKMEEVVRHATEVGASSFVAFPAARSVSRPDAAKGARKAARWGAVAKSAAMQAGRPLIPAVTLAKGLGEVCAGIAATDAAVVFWEEAAPDDTIARALAHVGGPSANVAVIVGPEGGFERAEVDAMLAASPHARVATLGPSILRTETAGIVGCALVAYELGGMGRASAEAEGAR